VFEGTVDMENHHHFVRHYDLERPRKESLSLERLANLLIHSFVFAVFPGDRGRYQDAHFFFNSDRNKDKVVHEMQVSDFKAIIAEVLGDEVVHVSIDKSTGKFHQHNRVWKQQQIEVRERNFDRLLNSNSSPSMPQLG
jgi:hypothetical protein